MNTLSTLRLIIYFNVSLSHRCSTQFLLKFNPLSFSPPERLALMLRFMITRESFRSLEFPFPKSSTIFIPNTVECLLHFHSNSAYVLANVSLTLQHEGLFTSSASLQCKSNVVTVSQRRRLTRQIGLDFCPRLLECGASLSNVSETFRARKAISKSHKAFYVKSFLCRQVLHLSKAYNYAAFRI